MGGALEEIDSFQMAELGGVCCHYYFLASIILLTGR